MRPHDLALVSPDERIRELARILALGVLRLRARAALPTDPAPHPAPENLPKSSTDYLAVGAETRLSVHVG